jgi:hypothetical protein
MGFKKIMTYLHVYLDYDESISTFGKKVKGLTPVKVFAHYTGPEPDTLRAQYRRVHECNRLQLLL